MPRRKDEAESPLLWTRETRARASPRRRHGVRAALPGDGAARALLRSVYTPRRAVIVQGERHAEGELAAIQRSAIAELDGAAAFSPVAAAAAAVLLAHDLAPSPGITGVSLSRAFVDAWLEQGGPGLAVSTCAATMDVDARREADGAIVLVPAATELRHWDGVEQRWVALRRRIATMPDDAYREARSVAEELLAGAPPRLASRLAYAFPDEASFSVDVTRRLLVAGDDARLSILLHALADRALVEAVVARVAHRAFDLARFAWDIADGLELEAAGPLLVIANALKEGGPDLQKERREVAAALALVPTPDVAAWLGAHLEDPSVRPAASTFFLRRPDLAVPTLATEIASGPRKKRDGAAAELLAGAVRAAPPSVLEEADPDEVPGVLAAPPWASGKKRPRKKAPTLALTPLPFAEEVVLPSVPEPEPAATDVVARVEEELAKGGALSMQRLDRLPTEVARELFRRLPVASWYNDFWLHITLTKQLARFGVDAIEPILGFAPSKPGEVAIALEGAASPRVASVMAHVLANVPKARRAAERWLVAHPRAAAIGLLPELFGADTPARARASTGRALRFLVLRGKRGDLEAVAREHGAACSAALDEALAAETWETGAPSKPPRLPAWFVPESLVRPRLNDGKALPVDAVRALGEMLAWTDHAEPYPGIDVVRQACDPATLGEFAWGIFEAWALAGHPTNERWAFFAIGHFGRDEHAHRLAALLRRWPSESAVSRALMGLDVLATMKSDLALTLLHGIAEKVKSRPLQERARQKMESVAESLGVGTEELADRLVPTLGLDDRGSKVLDFGARTFQVGFDEHLRPFVRDGATVLTDLPKPGKNDDDRATSATAEWKTIKKAAKATAAAQVARLETAMITRRRWEPEAFATYLARHPLMSHLVRRIVFGVYDATGALAGAFRVAEDATYADASEDTPFVIPDGASIGVLHPLDVSPSMLAAIGARLTEYEILQPFLQVGRETPRDALAGVLTRRASVETLKLLGLERRGWRRGAVEDRGMVRLLDKEIGPFRAELLLRPGIYAGAPKAMPIQTLHEVSFTRAGSPGQPDPMFLAEVVADLRAVGALLPGG